MNQIRRPLAGILAMLLGASLLSGCAAAGPDTQLVSDVIAQVEAAHPVLSGMKTKDLTGILDGYDYDNFSVPVPIQYPDASAIDPAKIIVETPSETTIDRLAVQEATYAGIDFYIGLNADTLPYRDASLKVHLIKDAETGSWSGEVAHLSDLDALEDEIEVANFNLAYRVTKASLPLRQFIVTEKLDTFIEQVTGTADQSFIENSRITAFAPLADDQFTVTLEHPDLAAYYEAAGAKAVESYGTGKIWGEVSKESFKTRVDEQSVSLEQATTAETTFTVRVEVNDAVAETDVLLDAISGIAEASYVYVVESPPVPDTDSILEKYRAQVNERAIKAQKEPGTKRLKAGTSGRQITLKVGKYYPNLHITFFKWGTEKQVVSVFVHSGKTFTFRVPNGSYRMVYASGSTWYGKKYSFGPNGNYSEFSESSGTKAMKIQIKSNYSYTISLGVAGGTLPSRSTDNPYEE
ncbi:MAG: hypothetical protein LBR20_04340 [Propionibacteriaceae bacterium]|jgi:hypothetical protein|nr:hypothetical protein [Propionibacteriaceae bacterium]